MGQPLAVPFHDRVEAGRALGRALLERQLGADAVVLVLAPSAARLGYEVARALGAPLDVLTVAGVVVPGDASAGETRIGAVAHGGAWYLTLPRTRELDPIAVQTAVHQALEDAARRAALYRGAREAVALAERTIVLVDDGLAEPSAVRAAVRAIRQQGPRRVLFALPGGGDDATRAAGCEADDVLTLGGPGRLGVAGAGYDDDALADGADVASLVDRAARSARGNPGRG